ncbi:leucine-rich repeat receptor protein kinase EMS1 [Phalaenopsis equestris]|uniref:leucine-rich repeat receptor protein kinase EMS1 n=1 Tax=Phalaenopsis equestris TaxID=78828 RepID=UPI0009E40E36|nr:leucine-rich repeat receptor protein kinase EMS1 [Phalaenopsis equestris]
MEPILQALIAAAGSFSAISLLFLVVLFFCRSRPPKPPPPFLSISFPTPSSALPLPTREHSFSFDPSLPYISLSDLETATKNFSPDRILGDGGFGFVYKAIFPSGAPVAVKRLSPDLAPFQGFREFRAEMDTLARIHHPNLARLLGYCIAGSNRLLIYEFLPGGSLDQRLHDPDPDYFPPLTWSVRLSILRGVAAGLAFLHEGCRPSIIHRDIKASNVLLDGESVARIADFGLARLVESSRSHVSTQEAAGTVGYMAPEYREGVTAVTAKGDIYSFGVLVMEVVTGRRPSWPVKTDDGGEIGLVKWTRAKFEEGREMEILDPLMGKEAVAETEVKGLLGVAYRSTEERPSSRPSIGEVIKLLDSF